MDIARTPGLASGLARRWRVAMALLVLAAVSIWAFSERMPAGSGASGVRADPDDVYNPVVAGEDLPYGFRQLLPRDAIRPIYDPTFVNGSASDWPDSTQVIGVALGGKAKAYPVSHLGGRELVVDELDGIPILVSW